MIKILIALTLGISMAMEQTIDVPISEEETPEMVPKAEWARAPHDEPGTLIDGRIKTKADQEVMDDDATGGDATGATGGDGATGATGGMMGDEEDATGATGSESGLVNNPREPQATHTQDCADCGASQDKVDADGTNTRPIIADAHVVMHTDYNATGDYVGHGTPIEGVADPSTPPSGEKCCRVCPPASECDNKDECFHKCKRVCGPTCSIDAPPAPCDAKKDENCEKAKPVPITPEMVKIIADTPAEDKVAKIKALLRGAQGDVPKATPKDTGAVVVDDAVGTL
jgi:hypothetical protein